MNSSDIRWSFSTILYFVGASVVAAVAMIFLRVLLQGVGSEAEWAVIQFAPKAIFALILTLFIRAWDKRTLHISRYRLTLTSPYGITFSFLVATISLAVIYTEKSFSIQAAGYFYQAPTSIAVARLVAWISVQGLLLPLVEEVMFRGRIFPALSTLIRSHPISAIITSLIFLLFHPNNITESFIFSLLVCYAARRFGLWSAVVAHSLYNSTLILVDNFVAAT